MDPRNEIPGSQGHSIFNFLRGFCTISLVTTLFYSPPTIHEGSCFSTYHFHFCNNHPSRGQLTSLTVVLVLFFDDECAAHIFIYLWVRFITVVHLNMNSVPPFLACEEIEPITK